MTCAWTHEIESNAIAKTKTPRFLRRVFALGGWCFAEDETLRVGCIRHEIILLNYRSYSHARWFFVTNANHTATATNADALRKGNVGWKCKSKFDLSSFRNARVGVKKHALRAYVAR